MGNFVVDARIKRDLNLKINKVNYRFDLITFRLN